LKLYSQDRETFGTYEDSLKSLGIIMRNGANDRIKFEASAKFANLLEEALSLKNSFNYPFDSVNLIARLTSPDKRFRIFNWVIAKQNGTYEYNCYLQSFNEKKKKYDVFKLNDKSSDIIAPETQTLDPENWYGALYYKIIVAKNEDVTYYTLLGWNGNNGISFIKLIEVLTFRSGNRPFFGAAIFRKGKEKSKRIIFEYSNKAIMTLKHEPQQYQVKKRLKKPEKGKRFIMENVKSEMILFDRLVPLNTSLKGQKQFYVPETNVFDAFIFEKGKWLFIEDIDARNKAIRENRNQPEKVPQLQLYSPK
jgi:hypothetical protein